MRVQHLLLLAIILPSLLRVPSIGMAQTSSITNNYTLSIKIEKWESPYCKSVQQSPVDYVTGLNTSVEVNNLFGDWSSNINYIISNYSRGNISLIEEHIRDFNGTNQYLNTDKLKELIINRGATPIATVLSCITPINLTEDLLRLMTIIPDSKKMQQMFDDINVRLKQYNISTPFYEVPIISNEYFQYESGWTLQNGTQLGGAKLQFQHILFTKKFDTAFTQNGKKMTPSLKINNSLGLVYIGSILNHLQLHLDIQGTLNNKNFSVVSQIEIADKNGTVPFDKQNVNNDVIIFIIVHLKELIVGMAVLFVAIVLYVVWKRKQVKQRSMEPQL